jgi:hypothetical protein
MIVVCVNFIIIYMKGVEFMGLFLTVSNWVGALCGTYVVYKLAKLAISKEKK